MWSIRRILYTHMQHTTPTRVSPSPALSTLNLSFHNFFLCSFCCCCVLCLPRNQIARRNGLTCHMDYPTIHIYVLVCVCMLLIEHRIRLCVWMAGYVSTAQPIEKIYVYRFSAGTGDRMRTRQDTRTHISNGAVVVQVSRKQNMPHTPNILLPCRHQR